MISVLMLGPRRNQGPKNKYTKGKLDGGGSVMENI